MTCITSSKAGGRCVVAGFSTTEFCETFSAGIAEYCEMVCLSGRKFFWLEKREPGEVLPLGTDDRSSLTVNLSLPLDLEVRFNWGPSSDQLLLLLEGFSSL